MWYHIDIGINTDWYHSCTNIYLILLLFLWPVPKRSKALNEKHPNLQNHFYIHLKEIYRTWKYSALCFFQSVLRIRLFYCKHTSQKNVEDNYFSFDIGLVDNLNTLFLAISSLTFYVYILVRCNIHIWVAGQKNHYSRQFWAHFQRSLKDNNRRGP